MKPLNIVLLVTIFVTVHSTFAQTWMQTGAPTNGWSAVACSADGNKLVALANRLNPCGYTSTNSGLTWATNGAPGASWCSVASSADGIKLVAATVGVQVENPRGFIYISADSGSTWQLTSAPSNEWFFVASSANGCELAALAAYTTSNSPGSVYGLLFISTNSGTTWQSNNVSQAWDSVALSADGSVLAGICGTELVISTNSGVAWKSKSLPAGVTWQNILCTADGSNLMAVGYGRALITAAICTSTNLGTSWTSNSFPIASSSLSIASSADGITLVGAGGDLLCVSTDSGITWTTNVFPNMEIVCVASSADGHTLFAVISPTMGHLGKLGGGLIYTWYSPPTPRLNLAPSDTGLVLSWLVPSTNFMLQQNSDLSTSNWMTVTNATALNLTNLQNQVILPPPAGNSFYRLATP